MAIENILEKINGLTDEDIWVLFANLKKELKSRGLVRTNNIVGERGESLVVSVYNDTSGLPKLQKAPEGTQNVDAISRKGDRYSVKAITLPGKTTGVFYGIGPDEDDPPQKFEYVVIVVLNDALDLVNMYELDWASFLRHKRWHSRMRAYNLSLTKDLIKDCKTIK